MRTDDFIWNDFVEIRDMLLKIILVRKINGEAEVVDFDTSNGRIFIIRFSVLLLIVPV